MEEGVAPDERVLVVLNNTRVPRELALPVSFSEGTHLIDALGYEEFTVRNGSVHFSRLEPLRGWVLLRSA
ncbi:hypothetical protein Mgrana_02372 [Meiothermus granaticius NBRC 107808]|uniref:Maltogenic Amylase C-terminal domain-containing protein n=1 Tax=Meiothermus granaticius NBRC 107808 TaxID=1227551 RepID=A0A399F7R3_9DEIN|nr:hypothetical protein Mgrana_02372 [Meiothermus granaticius NBRC 107808]